MPDQEAARASARMAAHVRAPAPGRLVGEDHGQPGDQRPGDRHPLVLAAGQLAGPVTQPVCDARPLGNLTEPGAAQATAGQP